MPAVPFDVAAEMNTGHEAVSVFRMLHSQRLASRCPVHAVESVGTHAQGTRAQAE